MRSIFEIEELLTFEAILKSFPSCAGLRNAGVIFQSWLSDDPKMVDVEKLPSKYLIQGPVYKQPLFEKDGYTFSMLVLPPGTAIAEHLHDEDQEHYVFITSQEVRFCPLGGTHALDNPNKHPIIVLSIKQQLK